jgi:hypothetical protein
MLSILLILSFNNSFAQELTKVRGKVIDAVTKEPIPFALVVFKGTIIGAETDLDGNYSMSSKFGTNQLSVTSIGYKEKIVDIKLGGNIKVNFQIEPTQFNLQEVQVKAKRKRYKNKNNKAVSFMDMVRRNRDLNRKEALDYYEFDKYEVLRIDQNNITDEYRQKKRFKDVQFIFDHVDTSDINGKPFLPMFIKEVNSKVYYRKSPKSKKEYKYGEQLTGLEQIISTAGLSAYIDNLYQDINIYDNKIYFMTHDFVSPISNQGKSVYKYFLIDTVNLQDGTEVVKVGFQPRTQGNFCFNGYLFVSNDGKYTVRKVDMGVSTNINLNFVSDVKIEQEYNLIHGEAMMLTKDNMVIDLNFGNRGKGYFLRKKSSYKDYAFHIDKGASTYNKNQKIVTVTDYNNRDSSFWKSARHIPLTKKEAATYVMVDSLQKIPTFKRTLKLMSLALFGYWELGPISIGNMATFYQFNEVEGFKGRIGFETNKDFSKTWVFNTYVGYGTKDKRWKYAVGLTKSFTDQHFLEPPEHYIKFEVQKESLFPGSEMQMVNEDNFMLSFKRGVSDKIMYYFKKNIEYFYNINNGIAIGVDLSHIENEAGSVTLANDKPSWAFEFKDGSFKDKITRSEVKMSIRYAPNEKYIPNRNYKIPIYNRFPVIQLNYIHGFKDVFGSDYSYDKIWMNIFKRFYPSPIGETDVEIEGGLLFGEVPLPLLYIMRGNQTYSYQINNYNMMNFMEFVADKYASLQVEHAFNGYFFNKIPLLKRLKLREVVTFKGVIGSLSEKNNPLHQNNTSSMLFPVDVDGNNTTYTLNNGGYVEVSVGIENIFKFFRVDLVRRLTHNGNPNVSKYGIRGRFRIEF